MRVKKVYWQFIILFFFRCVAQIGEKLNCLLTIITWEERRQFCDFFKNQWKCEIKYEYNKTITALKGERFPNLTRLQKQLNISKLFEVHLF